MELNYDTLNAKICVMCAEAAMVDYIYENQGAEARRLDYNAAAKAMNCSRRTVGRYLKSLVAHGVVKLVNMGDKWAVKLNPEILKEED